MLGMTLPCHVQWQMVCYNACHVKPTLEFEHPAQCHQSFFPVYSGEDQHQQISTSATLYSCNVHSLHLSLSLSQHVPRSLSLALLVLILLSVDGNLLLLGAHLLVQVVYQQVMVLLPLLHTRRALHMLLSSLRRPTGTTTSAGILLHGRSYSTDSTPA